ncbi:uncharacterized protein LOC115695149 [Cannabis sativa]|uniref:uncharacterized protein LOC115695149 n=1 Tax=Cannabis sativa TaxID=3483 RepID=UPI0011DF7503|nr:uncharacterized protein LOC115695149 [Cannabis sativa]
MNCKMNKAVPVRTHVLHMIELMHKAETREAIIDKRTQMSMILELLSPCFKAFITNYVMNKLEFNMTQLLNEVTVFENLNKDKSRKGESNIVEAKSNSPSSSDKKRKWNYNITAEASP